MKCLCRTMNLALAVFLVVPLIVSYVSAAPQLSEWSAPVNLGPIVNSAADEFQPQLSSDRKMLLFTSNRPGGFGDFDLYLTVRSKPGH